MKKTKSTVFQNIKIKRIVPGFSLKSLGTILLLPFMITFLLGNFRIQEAQAVHSTNMDTQLTESFYSVINTTTLGTETVPLEIYVADKLARSINHGFELETLKAQAVLVRSNLLADMRNSREIYVEDTFYGSLSIPEIIWQAVAQTAGVCVTFQGKPARTPYFAVSNGATRKGEELQLGGYDYLCSALCSRDFLAEDYSSSIAYDYKEFEKIWVRQKGCEITKEEIINSNQTTEQVSIMEEDFHIYRDSVGYVLYVEKQGKYISGEQFRKVFGLSSGCFHLEQKKKDILITVKGVGHGFGMSQYGANELAKQQKDYIEIIETFFDYITITKIE